MEVIPAIIAKNFTELEQKIKIVEQHVQWVQLDVMDGKFVPNITWNDPKWLKDSDFSVFLEAHLMIADPYSYIGDWLDSGIKRVIVHIEAVGEEKSHTKEDVSQHQIVDMAAKARAALIEFGLALNPETPISAIEEFIPYIDLVLILAVSPGFGGQQFRPEILDKIKNLRQKFPKLPIEVDGGINYETGDLCAKAGADIVAVGSYIFNSPDPKKSIEKLKAL